MSDDHTPKNDPAQPSHHNLIPPLPPELAPPLQAAFDVEAVAVAEADEEYPRDPNVPPCTRQRLEVYAAGRGKGSNPESTAIWNAWRDVANGKRIVRVRNGSHGEDRGNVREFVVKMAEALAAAGAQDWRGEDVEAVASGSLAIIAADDLVAGNPLGFSYERGYLAHKFDLAAARERCARAKDAARDLGAAARSELRDDISRAMVEVGQHGPKILVYQNAYYVRDEEHGFAGPFTDREVIAQATQRKSFPTTEPHGKGEREITARRAMEAFGTGGALVGVQLEFGGERGRLEGTKRDPVLIKPLGRIDPQIQPRRHDIVERWLELLAGDRLDLLLDWLAVVTDFPHTVPAVFLRGAPGLGKSLLAEGLAAIFGCGAAVDAKHMIGDAPFNDAIVKQACPVVHCEESIPELRRGKPDINGFKTLISNKEREVNGKNKPLQNVVGGLRVIVSTNSDSILRLGAGLTQEDVEAIAERVIYIRIPDENRPAIKALLAHTDGVQRLVAEHCLWLRDTRGASVARGPRFRCAADGGALTEELRLNGDGGDSLLEGICDKLTAANAIDLVGSPTKPGVRLDVSGDRLLLTPTGAKAIGVWEGREAKRVSEILGRVCGKRTKSRAWGGEPTHCYALPLDVLAAWADLHHDGRVREHVARIANAATMAPTTGQNANGSAPSFNPFAA